MEFLIKKEWQFAGIDKIKDQLKDLLQQTYKEIEPLWSGLMQSVFKQILTSYYEYQPTMYAPYRRESLYNGYTFSISRHGGFTESKDKFEASGHWSITGSPNFSDDAIIMYVMMGHRSVPPWVHNDITPRTYTASVYLPEVGFSATGYSPDIWESADAAVTHYIEERISEVLWEKIVKVFLESPQEYYK